MLENSANKPAPAQDTRFRQDSSACWWLNGLAIIAGVLMLVFIALVMLDWLSLKPVAEKIGYDKPADGMSPEAKVFRDIIVLWVAAVGILMAAGRNCSMNKQVEVMSEQARATNDQARLTNERYYSDQFDGATELMSKESNNGKPLIDVRISGIYTMANLAIKQPQEFAERVVKHLITYIANAQLTPTLTKNTKPHQLRGDVKVAFSVLRDIFVNEKAKKDIDEEILDFSQCDFSGLDFRGIDLSHYTKWTGAKFIGCDLTGVRFADSADMRSVKFSNANLTDTIMSGIDLSRADFRGATLTCTQMQGANLFLADMHGCHMGGTELQKTDNGKITKMAHAKLTGAYLQQVNLGEAYMASVDLRGAFVSGDLRKAGLLGAKFGKTHMKMAMLNIYELPEQVKEAMNKKIWRGDSPHLKEIDELPNEVDWKLEEFEDGYALAGFLANFACGPEYTKEYNRLFQAIIPPHIATSIWKEAAKLEKPPENTPQKTKDWLAEIKAKYSK